MPKKPWHKNSWIKKRAHLIEGKSCEWCGSTEKLCIHHKETFYANFRRNSLAFQLMKEYFHNGLHSEEKEQIRENILKTTRLKYYAACPKCGKSMQARKTVQPKYRCWRCHLNTSEPLQKLERSTINWLNKRFFYEWAAAHQKEIDEKFNPLRIQKDQEYLNFTNVMILCWRCHYALHKGMHLCPTCKKHYVRGSFNQCWYCAGMPKKGG